MNPFKAGDKVVCVKTKCSGGLELGGIYEVQSTLGSAWATVENMQYSVLRFKLHEENNMFDMKKDKWFIRTPTPEISEAVQLWLFEQGFTWYSFSRRANEIYHTDRKILSKSEGTGREFGFSNICDDFYLHDAKEIKLTFKTSVASVEYPVVETEAEKELKVLEQKIQELTEQASKLRSVIK